jgi:Na+/melibiose symporter-like transporter
MSAAPRAASAAAAAAAADGQLALTPRLSHQLFIGGAKALPDGARVPLPMRDVAFYSVGHVLNDMAAAVWFSYLLLYLQEAEGLSGTQAGAVMFAGQIADALATPLVGILSDAGRGCAGLGRRKAWNLFGVVVVALNFGLMFGGTLVPGWAALAPTPKAAALGVFAALFNVGWAAVQVSHMSLVPELTRDEGERVLLNSARYGNTVLSNCAVFLVMLSLLPDASSESGTDPRYKQPRVYQSLAAVVLGVGLLCSAAFLLLGREPRPEELQAREDADAALAARAAAAGQSPEAFSAAEAAAAREAAAAAGGEGAEAPLLAPAERRGSGDEGAFYDVRGWRDWLRVGDFWRTMSVYTFVRLSVNISQVYLTFFVTETLAMSQSAVAVTPLLLYLAQLASTAASRRVAVRLGRRRSIFLGSALTVAACASMLFIQPGASAPVVYASVLLLGAGLALSMVISVSVEADLVGNRLGSAAFVYGACSFADKLSSGVFVLAIQTLRDVRYPKGNPQHELFIRCVNAIIPAASAVLAAAIAATLRFPKAPEAGELARTGGALNDGDGGGGGGGGGAARLAPPRMASVSGFFATEKRPLLE